MELLVGKIVLVVVVIVFFLGLGYFNSQVAEACTHGNCVHGWDSKYTHTEQRYFQLWLIGFPIIAYFIVYHFADEGDESAGSGRAFGISTLGYPVAALV